MVQGAVGDGKANDTAAIQAAIDASIGKGIAYAPANGTHLLGGGLKFIGHSYDGKGQRFVERTSRSKSSALDAGVRMRFDAPFKLIDDDKWPHCPRPCNKTSR